MMLEKSSFMKQVYTLSYSSSSLIVPLFQSKSLTGIYDVTCQFQNSSCLAKSFGLDEQTHFIVSKDMILYHPENDSIESSPMDYFSCFYQGGRYPFIRGIIFDQEIQSIVDQNFIFWLQQCSLLDLKRMEAIRIHNEQAIPYLKKLVK